MFKSLSLAVVAIAIAPCLLMAQDAAKVQPIETAAPAAQAPAQQNTPGVSYTLGDQSASGCNGCNTGCNDCCGPRGRIMSRVGQVGNLFNRQNCGTGCATGCDTGCNSGCNDGCGPAYSGVVRNTVGRVTNGVRSVGGRIGSRGCQTGCGTDCGTPNCGGCDTGCGNGMQLGNRGMLTGILPSVDFSFGSGCGQKYISFFGGVSELNSYDGNAFGTFRDGFVLGVARGQYIGGCNRIEFENSWRNNSGSEWVTAAGGRQPFDGHFNVFSGMVNVIREVNFGRGFELYGGGGIGLATQDGDFTVGANQFRLDDMAFAYQAIFGMNFAKNAARDLFIEYRYYGNTTTQLELAGVDFDDFDYDSHNINFGIRLRR